MQRLSDLSKVMLLVKTGGNTEEECGKAEATALGTWFHCFVFYSAEDRTQSFVHTRQLFHL
jgi:hypothetical protein